MISTAVKEHRVNVKLSIFLVLSFLLLLAFLVFTAGTLARFVFMLEESINENRHIFPKSVVLISTFRLIELEGFKGIDVILKTPELIFIFACR